MQIHTLQGYIQNIHLVEYEYGCMLLDGACRVDLDLIIDYFKLTLKRPIKDLKVVMVTHMHPDHAGCANKLRELTGCKVITGKTQKQWYKGLGGRIAHIVDMSLALWVAGRLGRKRKNLWYSPRLNPDYMLDDYSSVPGFDDWRIINTPGHTDRDISLINHSQKLIYVADLIVSVKKQFAPPFPVYLPNEYKNALHRIKAFDGYTMLMAHVPAIKLAPQEIQTLIAKAPRKPQTTLLAIKRKIQRFSKQTSQ